MKIRVGFGFDVHQLVAGRELWLGGIRLDIEGTELDGTVQNRLASLRRDIAAVTL